MAFCARTVDIAAWVSGGVDRDRARSAAAVDQALAEFSVVQLIGHGIPDSVLRSVVSAMDELFALGADEKKALEAPAGHNRGFSPVGSEALSRSLGLRSEQYDGFEALSVGAEEADYPHAKTPGVAYAPSVWPAIPDFRRHVDTYFNEAGRVTRTLMSVLGEGLGVGPAFFNGITDHSIDTMRLLHYPGSQLPETGMSAHTDYGFSTLAWADSVPGLQVAHEGEWHELVPEKGALLMFVGDLLARTTNDHWRPTLHRVQTAAGLDRRSIMYYHDGNAEALVSPIAALVAPGEKPHYPPVIVRDHITAKIAASRFGAEYVGDKRARERLPAS